MAVQFIGGPWDGRIEDYPSTYHVFSVLVEEDRPVYSYTKYRRERVPEPGTPVCYIHMPGTLEICGVRLDADEDV